MHACGCVALDMWLEKWLIGIGMPVPMSAQLQELTREVQVEQAEDVKAWADAGQLTGHQGFSRVTYDNQGVNG